MVSGTPQQEGSVASILGPRALGDIFRDTFGIYGKNFLRFLIIVAIYTVPVSIVSALVQLWGASLAIVPQIDPSSVYLLLLAALLAAAAIIVTLAILSLVGSGAIIHAVSEHSLRGTVAIRRAYRFAWGRLLSLAGAQILAGLAVGLAAITIIGIPFAVYFGVRWQFAAQAVILEGRGAVDALSHSGDLVKGSWWRVVGIMFAAGIVTGILGALIGLPFGIASGVLSVPSGSYETGVIMPLEVIVSTVGGVLSSVITGPITGIWATLLYYDLRVRKEGYSLETLAKELRVS